MASKHQPDSPEEIEQTVMRASKIGGRSFRPTFDELVGECADGDKKAANPILEKLEKDGVIEQIYLREPVGAFLYQAKHQSRG